MAARTVLSTRAMLLHFHTAPRSSIATARNSLATTKAITTMRALSTTITTCAGEGGGGGGGPRPPPRGRGPLLAAAAVGLAGAAYLYDRSYDRSRRSGGGSLFSSPLLQAEAKAATSEAPILTSPPSSSSSSSSSSNSLSAVNTATEGNGAASAAAAAAPGSERDNLPLYTRQEVRKHASRDSLWVTYREGVYDVTEFVAGHPGGADKIMMAAGSALDPLWNHYRQHSAPEVQAILAEYRIGTLKAGEAVPVVDANDPYAKEPERHPALLVRKEQPFNAETPRAAMDTYLTPTSLWYVRHHHPVPEIDTETFRLSVRGLGIDTPMSLSVADLRTKFPRVTITSTMQCGGNRRSEYEKTTGKKTQGLQWTCGAMSTAKFTGARLSDVLKAGGLTDEQVAEKLGAEHVQFFGADKPFDASIPMEKAMSRRGDVLLVYDMNDQPLPRDHGAPVRVLVPGYIGARSVKWCTDVVVSEEESYSTWQRGVAYKMISPNTTKFGDNIKPEDLPGVMEMPVQSVITSPASNSTLSADEETLEVQGVAYSGGGHKIVRVDVSADDGASWHTAELLEGKDQPRGRSWAWTQWRAEIKVPEAAKNVTVCCKAVDAAANQQQASCEGLWNLRGILNNAWHSVTLNVVADEKEE